MRGGAWSIGRMLTRAQDVSQVHWRTAGIMLGQQGALTWSTDEGITDSMAAEAAAAAAGLAPPVSIVELTPA